MRGCEKQQGAMECAYMDHRAARTILPTSMKPRMACSRSSRAYGVRRHRVARQLNNRASKQALTTPYIYNACRVLPVDPVHCLPLHPLVPAARQEVERRGRGWWLRCVWGAESDEMGAL